MDNYNLKHKNKYFKLLNQIDKNHQITSSPLSYLVKLPEIHKVSLP